MLPISNDTGEVQDSQEDRHETQIQGTRAAEPPLNSLLSVLVYKVLASNTSGRDRPAQVPSIDSVRADMSALTRQQRASGEPDEQPRGKRRDGVWMYEC